MTEPTVVQLSIDPRFTRLLVRQNDIQAWLKGVYPSDMDDDQKVQFIKDMTLALSAETTELLEETHWKPWGSRGDEPVIPNLQRYIGEMADVFIFFMNLMLVAGVSMNDIAQAVEAKQQKNLNRWANGYSGKKEKCSRCGRAYDDDGVGCMPATRDLSALCTRDG